jgi:hypothetical protein
MYCGRCWTRLRARCWTSQSDQIAIRERVLLSPKFHSVTARRYFSAFIVRKASPVTPSSTTNIDLVFDVGCRYRGECKITGQLALPPPLRRFCSLCAHLPLPLGSRASTEQHHFSGNTIPVAIIIIAIPRSNTIPVAIRMIQW